MGAIWFNAKYLGLNTGVIIWYKLLLLLSTVYTSFFRFIFVYDFSWFDFPLKTKVIWYQTEKQKSGSIFNKHGRLNNSYIHCFINDEVSCQYYLSLTKGITDNDIDDNNWDLNYFDKDENSYNNYDESVNNYGYGNYLPFI